MKIICTFAGGSISSEEFAAPQPPIVVGDVLRFLVECTTLKGEHYFPGDTIKVVGFTDKTPHGRTTTQGCLLILGKDGEVAAWSSVEYCLAQGLLAR